MNYFAVLSSFSEMWGWVIGIVSVVGFFAGSAAYSSWYKEEWQRYISFTITGVLMLGLIAVADWRVFGPAAPWVMLLASAFASASVGFFCGPLWDLLTRTKWWPAIVSVALVLVYVLIVAIRKGAIPLG